MCSLFTLLLTLWFCQCAFAGFADPVVSVLDGDTIEVLHNTHPERIRLSGIDCPEEASLRHPSEEQLHSKLHELVGHFDTPGIDRLRYEDIPDIERRVLGLPIPFRVVVRKESDQSVV